MTAPQIVVRADSAPDGGQVEARLPVVGTVRIVEPDPRHELPVWAGGYTLMQAENGQTFAHKYFAPGTKQGGEKGAHVFVIPQPWTKTPTATGDRIMNFGVNLEAARPVPGTVLTNDPTYSPAVGQPSPADVEAAAAGVDPSPLMIGITGALLVASLFVGAMAGRKIR